MLLDFCFYNNVVKWFNIIEKGVAIQLFTKRNVVLVLILLLGAVPYYFLCAEDNLPLLALTAWAIVAPIIPINNTASELIFFVLVITLTFVMFFGVYLLACFLIYNAAKKIYFYFKKAA